MVVSDGNHIYLITYSGEPIRSVRFDDYDFCEEQSSIIREQINKISKNK